MKVIIGSKNKTKITAVQTVFQNNKVIAHQASSQIASQPSSDEETRQGAINRAVQCATEHPGHIGIGLEGGIMVLEDQLYLCNWGALAISEEEVFTASGARIVLPNSFMKPLNEGMELSVLMDQLTHRKDIRNHSGAVGIFTSGLVSRTEMYTHIVKLLKGQWKYEQIKSSGT